jgi:hypothetical protein
MTTSWSIEDDETFNNDTSTSTSVIMLLEDVEPSTISITTEFYLLDYSLMAAVFAILTFLWIQ